MKNIFKEGAISPNFIEANWKDLEKLGVEPNSSGELDIVKNIDTDSSGDPIHESGEAGICPVVPEPLDRLDPAHARREYPGAVRNSGGGRDRPKQSG